MLQQEEKGQINLQKYTLAFQNIWFNQTKQLPVFIYQSKNLLNSRVLPWPFTARLLRGRRGRWLHCLPQSATTMKLGESFFLQI